MSATVSSLRAASASSRTAGLMHVIRYIYGDGR
jgi:hypothetical protein